MINPWQNNTIQHQHIFEKFIAKGGLPRKKTENWQYSNCQSLLDYNAQISLYDKPSLIEDCDILCLDNDNNDIDNVIISHRDIDDITPRHIAHQQIVLANHAYTNKQVDIIIKKSCEKPLYLNLRDCINSRINIDIAANQYVVIITDMLGVTHQQVQNIVVQININNNAQLDQKFICDIGADTASMLYQQIHITRDARYKAHMLQFGGYLTRIAMDIILADKNSEAMLDTAYCGISQCHYDQNITIYHDSPYCFSRQNLYSLLTGQSHSTFQGKTYVAKNAIGTNGLQLSRALMLSSSAQMNAKPELEIYADDVKCSHAATIGKFEDSYIFYCQSRGIDKKTARRILAKAFLQQIFDHTDDIISISMLEYLDNKLSMLDFS